MCTTINPKWQQKQEKGKNTKSEMPVDKSYFFLMFGFNFFARLLDSG